ncbi:hypothetical protein ALC60_03758, partial [Trachymyrmex zeteki]
ITVLVRGEKQHPVVFQVFRTSRRVHAREKVHPPSSSVVLVNARGFSAMLSRKMPRVVTLSPDREERGRRQRTKRLNIRLRFKWANACSVFRPKGEGVASCTACTTRLCRRVTDSTPSSHPSL